MSKAQTLMQGVEKKPYLDYVKSDIISVKNMDDLKTLGKTMENAKRLDKREAEELFDSKYLQIKMVPQLAALAIVAPITIVPKQLIALINKIVPDLSNIPGNFQNGIAYRFVEASLLIGEGKNLFDNGIFATLFHDNPGFFAGPYLNLLASIKNPIDIFEEKSMVYTKESRIDVLTLYYYGVNLLLLNNYKKSEQYLLRAYRLAKKAKCKDIIYMIIEKLSLASFLNGTPFDVFIKYLKLIYRPEGIALNIWDLDNPQYINYIRDPKQFFDHFSKQIIQEHTRRVILDFAQSTSEMPLQLLSEATCNQDMMEVLVSLKSSGELKFKIANDNIKFIKFNYQVQIDREQQNINSILNTGNQ